uniref:Uncharacterized protein n=1 Tax=Rhizophagus irregularis (strain DAOM 181602 / DAOM 197198 / MUCL 43194) TaxID=747089 RepID=U9TJJ4_RHIID
MGISCLVITVRIGQFQEHLNYGTSSSSPIIGQSNNCYTGHLQFGIGQASYGRLLGKGALSRS